jgi:hemerythrin-like metal-binding protein
MGDECLDRQHRAMVAAINRLADAMACGCPEDETRKALSFLSVYVDAHFLQEEALMERLGFPGVAEHLDAHETCARRLEGLIERYRRKDETTLAELVAFLNHWLVDHFEGEDRRLRDFMKGQASPMAS